MSAIDSGQVRGVADAHSLAELYSVLTKLPAVLRADPDQARLAVGQVAAKLEIVPILADVAAAAVDRCAGKRLTSGAVFDAVHVLAAERASVDVLLTFNERDFVRLAEPATPRILVPGGPDAHAFMQSLAG